MTSTTTTRTSVRRTVRTPAQMLLAVAFWLVVWQVAAWIVGRDFLLASPWAVVVRLGELVTTSEFWGIVGTSLLRISLGFAGAVVVGVVSAALSARFRTVEILMAPLIITVRTVPVVSFIILVLLWIEGQWLATVTSFLMALPIMYTNVLEGIRQRDPSLLEVVAVFKVSWWRRVRAIDVPAVAPFFVTACATGIGMAWKAGVAAEVIAVAYGSIGGELYQAKLFLASADVFAWTMVIVGLSVASQAIVLRVVARAQRRIAGGVS